MSANTNSKTQASVWLKPEQVEALRSAVYRCRPDYLQQRDDALIALLYDTGLRVAELVAVDVDHLREDNSLLFVPAENQKDYPNDNSPKVARLGLAAVGVPRLPVEGHRGAVSLTGAGPYRNPGRPRPPPGRRSRGRRRTVPPRRLPR